jgi:thioredoxin family protein
MPDVKQIKLAGRQVGLKGLDQIFEDLAPKYSLESEAELAQEILARAQKTNYIPDGAAAEYSRALLDEFKRHLGLEVAPPEVEGIHIQVLGPGCAGCHQLVQNVIDALASVGKQGSVELVTDALEIAAARVKGQPALIINGQVKAVGTSPSPAQIERMLTDLDED